jgi:hypothetical protein
MAQWYEHQRDHGNHLWLYSERGWMSFLFWHVLADDLDFVLDNSTNQDGEPLRTVIGAFESHTTLTEHELGPQGFGTPDGAFTTVAPDRRCYVFIEAKQGSFADSYRPPDPKTVEELSAPDLDMDRLCEGNKFNSSINGQLELRWRFVNALRASAPVGEQVVSERRVRFLPPDLMAGDRFYWRLILQPDPNVTGHWRRVGMGGDLHCLYEHLVPVKDFYLLSITFDDNPPDFRRYVRLYDGDGNRLDAGKLVFWLDRSLIEDMLATI